MSGTGRPLTHVSAILDLNRATTADLRILVAELRTRVAHPFWLLRLAPSLPVPLGRMLAQAVRS